MKELKIIQKNTCGTCGYFMRHYAKINTRFQTIFCGHCINENAQKKGKKLPDSEPCAFWQSTEVREAERKTTIKETLNFMAKQVEEIVMILGEEETSN